VIESQATKPSILAGSVRRPLSVLGARRQLDGRFLLVTVVAAALLAALTVAVTTQRVMGLDVTVERVVQSWPLGFLGPFMAFVTWLAGLQQTMVGLAILALVIAFNWRAAPFAVAIAVSGPLYIALSDAVLRPRPSPSLVRVTEHLGGYSFPSGHANFVLAYSAMVLLAVGGRWLSRRQLLVAAIPFAAFLLGVSVARVYVGGHWPTDVLGGVLLATAWVSLMLSVRWLSDPVLGRLWPSLWGPAGLSKVRSLAVLAARWRGRAWAYRLAESRRFQHVERFGLVVRGLVWIAVGVVALAAAVGVVRHAVDLQGALALLLVNPFRLPLGLLAAAGLVAYAVWGYVRSFLDPLHRGRDLNGLMARLGFLWSGVAYTGLTVFAVQYALQGVGPGASGLPFGLESLLRSMFGGWLVCLGGVLVFVTGLGQFLDSVRAPFANDFALREANRTMWVGWTWLGRAGLFSRGVIFTLAGVLIFRAGLSGDPHWAYGIAQAFAILLGLPAGGVVVASVGLGFVALGLHSVASGPWLRLAHDTREGARP
jgi:membrane-associated phospholipid phosphatase